MLNAGGCKRVSQLTAILLLTSVLMNVAGEDQEISIPSHMEVEIVANISHDNGAFTQGLLWHQGMFYESTGLKGESTLREVFPNGTVNRSIDLDVNYFGEGLALVGETLVQLTWKNNIALVWNLSDFTLLGNLSYQGEGWGLCNNGTALVMSNGSDELTFRDPANFSIIRTINVTLDEGNIGVGVPVENLNELESNASSIWSNVWQENRIVRIDSESGKVDMFFDASELSMDGWGMLNGIAITEDGSMWLTGKNWPLMFQIELQERRHQENGTDETIGNEQQSSADGTNTCTFDDDCEEDTPLSVYLFYSTLTGLALSCAVIAIFKVRRALPVGEKRAPHLEVLDGNE